MVEEPVVLAANAAFYRAMREGDLGAMDALWSCRRSVSCTHPSGPAITGREAIMRSWRCILLEGGPVAIHPRGARALVSGRTALVLCEEVDGALVLMASNCFVHEAGAWRMLSHQAAAVPGRVI